MSDYTVKPDTIARTVCLALALANQTLALFGKEKLPFVENDVYQFVTLICTFAAAAVSWWKNNSFTPPAIEADEYMKDLKSLDAMTFNEE